jgi:hypothetical protein
MLLVVLAAVQPFPVALLPLTAGQRYGVLRQQALLEEC